VICHSPGPPGRAACLTSVQPHSIKSSLCRDGPLGETLAQECLEVFRCVVITLPVPQSASPQTRDPNPALSEGETWTNPDHTRNPVIPEEGVLPTKCSMELSDSHKWK
ncbi:cAMP-dependent protein kinase regulatory subunit, partial [Dissostichus eleginoides]